MYPGDSETAWPSALLTDPRVQHRWDEPKAAGRWFLENLGTMKPTRGGGKFPQRVDAMWDTWIMFNRDAVWTGDAPSSVMSWGYTIMKTKEQLAENFALATAEREEGRR
jgi:hypothetical protein